MRFIVSFIFIAVFLAELVFDSSTMFVRASAPHSILMADSGPVNSADPSEPDQNDRSPMRLNLEISAHSALPISVDDHRIWVVDHSATQAGFADVVMPDLNPPVSKIKRPPIA